ncbi:MAG: HAD family phosphatase [Deltaproteobacteria bacterium]|nr:HAD family phosphatase [Deltaproteobacteria bacterium]
MSVNHEIGVIFDLDGTLVASEVLYYDATEALLAPLGRSLKELTPEEKARIPGRSAVVNMEFYRRRFGLEPPAVELVEGRLAELIRMVRDDGVDLLPGVFGFLEGLKARGFRLALASSAPRNYVNAVLDVTGLGSYFPVQKTGSDVKRYKPDPEIFQSAGQALGIPPERCLVVEDAHSGFLAARAADMKILAVRGDYTLSEQYELADRLVDDFRGLGPDDVIDLLGVGRA